MLIGKRKEYFNSKEMYESSKYIPIMKLDPDVAATAGKSWIVANRIVGKIISLEKIKDNYYKFIISDKNDRHYEFQLYKDYNTSIGDIVIIPAGSVTYRDGVNYNQSCLGYDTANKDEELSSFILEPNKVLNIEDKLDRVIFLDNGDKDNKNVRFALLRNED